MTPVGWAAVAVLLVAACSGSDGSDNDAAAGDPTVTHCARVLVEAFEGFDVTGIDPADGFDDAEVALATERYDALVAAKPVLAPDGECMTLVGEGDPDELQALFDRLDPVVVQLLTTPVG